jgi:hypothetical protein
MNGDSKGLDEASGESESRERRIGRLTLISLALNIFFVGAAGTLAVRYYLGERQFQEERRDDRNPVKRIEALAALLPIEDAAILRAEFALRAGAAETARESVRRNREGVRVALEAQPYDAAAAKRAMAASRAAHAAFFEVLQDVVAAAAGRMSPAGRIKLGEREGRRSQTAY